MILSLATLVYNGVSIVARESDKFINLELMALATGKRIRNWTRLKDTKLFLEELTNQGLTPIKSSKVKNHPDFGTWGDPKVALKLASWIDKSFEVQVYQWVEDLINNGYVVSPVATEQQLENMIAESIPKIQDPARLARLQSFFSHRLSDMLNGVELETISKEGLEVLRNRINDRYEKYNKEFLALKSQKESEWQDEELYPIFEYDSITDDERILSKRAKAARAKLHADKMAFFENEEKKAKYEFNTHVYLNMQFGLMDLGIKRNTADVLDFCNRTYPEFHVDA